jgi:hypothetical protein
MEEQMKKYKRPENKREKRRRNLVEEQSTIKVSEIK